MPSVFDQFTNQYALSKTLRFELKPVGETLENMRSHLSFDEKLQTFMKDQEIENAYQTLKPIFDSIHEKFINESLEQDQAKEIDFTLYKEYYNKKEDKDEKALEETAKKLRLEFSTLYSKTAEQWKKSINSMNQDEDEEEQNATDTKKKKKEVFKEKGYKILTEQGILLYIRKNIELFTDIEKKEQIEKALDHLNRFFTYLGGFNQNRENYYETGKESATAVATRCISDNLPKFCDNSNAFHLYKETYLRMYDLLKEANNSLTTKDGKTLYPIGEDIFHIKYYNYCLSQKEIENYNEQIGNANFLINLYNQLQQKRESTFKKIPLFKTLYKQIGCGKKNVLFFSITHNHQHEAEKARQSGNKEALSVEEVIHLAHQAGEKYFKGKNNDGTINTLEELLEYIENAPSYEGFYWSKPAINSISNKYFQNWHALKDTLKDSKVFGKGTKEVGDVKIPEAVELSNFFVAIDDTKEEWRETFFKESIINDKEKKSIIQSSSCPSKALIACIHHDIRKEKENFLEKVTLLKKLTGYKSTEEKELIKTCFDHALTIIQLLKYYLVRENKVKGTPVDAQLTSGLNVLLSSQDAEWFNWYDGLRNYLTKKPQEDLKNNKLKLNFENSTLAAGWDVNKEQDNHCILLENGNKQQFLAIIARRRTSGGKEIKGYNKIFSRTEDNPLYKVSKDSTWKKIEYKLLPGPNKMLPKCLLPKSDRSRYGATKEVLEVYDQGSFKKNEESFEKKNLHILIEFYKEGLKKYEDWKCFNFSFKKTEEYQDISEFYADVEKQGYKLGTVPINEEVLTSWVKEGKIYLFEIRNQDYNQNKAKGHKNNLHTLYWQSIFEEVVNRPKLNGEAEIFYRKALPKESITYKKDRNGKEVIEHFRFSKEKFVFHVPITLNFCLKNNRLTELINSTLKEKAETHFLGIDRGEKHLAYYSLVNQKGEILKQGTLNLPFLDTQGNPRTVKAEKRIKDKNGKEIVDIQECKDYNELLQARAGDRDYARKNWQTIGTIKELKEGYISQVVRQIADLAVKHNAYIVLEDLNTGFKRGRQKIEHALYQKLELALAKKLNFLVDKTAPLGAPGSVTNALQLTPPVSLYGDIEGRKQVGIMLYTRANYTSQTDPVTGWRKSIYLKKGSEDSIKKQIIDNFNEIRKEGKDYMFLYKHNGKTWTLYSGKDGVSLDRFRGKRNTDKNIWEVEKVNIVEILDTVFEKYDKNRDLLSQIEEGVPLTKYDTHSAWESLRFAIELIQQIRNTGITEEDGDFLQSPIRHNGIHFDSRKVTKKEQANGQIEAALPTSGDANGAFNIARKGLLMYQHIKAGYSLFIADEEWDMWLSGEQQWKEWINKNEKKLLKAKK